MFLTTPPPAGGLGRVSSRCPPAPGRDAGVSSSCGGEGGGGAGDGRRGEPRGGDCAVRGAPGGLGGPRLRRTKSGTAQNAAEHEGTFFPRAAGAGRMAAEIGGRIAVVGGGSWGTAYH